MSINNINKSFNYKIITLGCPVNQSEGASIDAAMRQAGFFPVTDNANIYIINSCAVTKSASRKSRYKVRQAKKENPEALIVLAGCYAQIDVEEVKKIVPEADIIIGTAGRSKNRILYLKELKKKIMKRYF